MAAFCSSLCSCSTATAVPSIPLPASKRRQVRGWSYSCCSADALPRRKYTPEVTKSLSASILAPLASCLVFSACCAPATAGILSGSPGLESFQLPSLPTPEFLKKIREENKIRYDGLDARLKSSSYVQELLKRSKENAEMRKREIQDKYCQRGADWGVGDCSVAAMSEDQRASFIEALKANAASE